MKDIMDYERLGSLSYSNNEKAQQEYKIRMQSKDVIVFPIKIHGRQSFLVPTWEILSLVESIGQFNASAAALYNQLPGVAQQYYTQNCLIEEIMMTNDIEGIFSTKKEITQALDAKKGAKPRFVGMAKKYAIIAKERYFEDIDLNTSGGIRALYDELVSDEVLAEERPDGEIFRKGPVYVVSKTQVTRHEGLSPEKEIILAMEQALNILRNTKLPILVRVAVFHYLFGYIHPFYDGNGRMIRFISSCLLKKNSFPLLALDLSRTIKEQKGKYYEAFRICNDKRNMGDITPFVIQFLELMESASDRMERNLIEGVNKLEIYQVYIDNHISPGDKKKNDLMHFFVQNALFAADPFFEKELQTIMKCSRTTVDKIISDLQQDGYPIIKGKDGKYNIFNLDLEKFDMMIEEEVK